MVSVPVSFITVHICHVTTRDVPVEHTRNYDVLNKQSINVEAGVLAKVEEPPP